LPGAVGVAGVAGCGAALPAVVGGVGAGPDPARVVAVAARRVVAVVGLAAAPAACLAVVAVVLDDAGAVLPGTAAGTDDVAVGSDEMTGALVALVGGPATANWPPRLNDGGPLSRSL
jgi:hypothetical protein